MFKAAALLLVGAALACEPAAPEPVPPATEDLRLVRRYAAVDGAYCTLTYEGGETTIKVAAAGKAQAAEVGEGVNIYFRLNGGQDEFEFDGVAADNWKQASLESRATPPGRPLRRGAGEADGSEWRGTWERAIEARIETLHGELFVTRYVPGEARTIILASATFDCPAKKEALGPLAEPIVQRLRATPTPTTALRATSTPTPTPTTRPTATPTRAPTVMPTPLPLWNRCAAEGQFCSSPTDVLAIVRYGANGIYAYRFSTGLVACGNEAFGDPLYGTVKQCDYSISVQYNDLGPCSAIANDLVRRWCELGGGSASPTPLPSSQPLRFVLPTTLPPATAGQPYLPGGQPFSFCDPPTTSFTTQCPPPGTTARNPAGGSPPYHFQLGTAGGFPPIGMGLGKDGQLTGTPQATGSYRFTVCAVDLKADFVCREVSLMVNSSTPTLVPTVVGPPQPPPPPPAPPRVNASGTITSLSCTWRRDTAPGDPRMIGTWLYTASGTMTGNVGDQINFARRLDGTGNSLVPSSINSGWTTQGPFGTRARAAGNPEAATWSIQGSEYGGNAATFELVLQVNGGAVATAQCRR